MKRDVSQSAALSAKLLQAAESVARTGRRRVVRVSGRSLAIVPRQTGRQGAPAVQTRKTRRRKRFDLNDPLWDIMGIARGSGSENVSGNVDAFLDEAYRADAP